METQSTNTCFKNEFMIALPCDWPKNSHHFLLKQAGVLASSFDWLVGFCFDCDCVLLDCVCQF